MSWNPTATQRDEYSYMSTDDLGSGDSLKKLRGVFPAYGSQEIIFYRKFYSDRNLQTFKVWSLGFFFPLLLSFKLLVDATRASL